MGNWATELLTQSAIDLLGNPVAHHQWIDRELAESGKRSSLNLPNTSLSWLLIAHSFSQ
jgi:hypothetical protein